jgi:hypothetical protein
MSGASRGLWVIFLLALPLVCEDSNAAKRQASGETRLSLTPNQDILIKSELAQGFIDPIKCDGDGNIYLMTVSDASSGILKLTPKGQKLTTFVAASSQVGLPVQHANYFSVDRDGKV